MRLLTVQTLPLGEVQQVQAPAVQGEFTPVTTFESILLPHQRGSAAPIIQLEKRGATPQTNQAELFNRQLLYKESVAAKLTSIGEYGLARPLLDCHTFRGFAMCRGCKSVKSFWNRCDNFYCPSCQPQLSKERATSIEWWTKLISQPKHVVLTVRNTNVLTQRYVKWFQQCLAKLRRLSFAKHWRGGCWSLECTNESQGWHLHAHLLVDANYIDAFQLSRHWARLVGQDYAIVKVKDARGKAYLQEVCKYAVKGTELASWSGQLIREFVTAFSGVRTFGVFGSLYGKRTEWREWINSLREGRKRCACGCSDFRIFSEAEYNWHCEHASGPLLSIPPPTAPDPQLQFAGLPR